MLARQVWHDHCTLDSALALISETAAETLQVARVNIWRLHAQHGVLRCVHAYERGTGAHNPPGYDEAFDADSEYGRQLDRVRVVDAADVARDATVSASWAALGDYLMRHGVRSLLDAPIRSEGVLLGVVCHEHVGGARRWMPEDEAFAGSIADYVAMAYEINRRREAEQRLRLLERHDPQTDLPNRDHLVEAVHSALRPAPDEGAGVTAIHLHIDTTLQDGEHDALVAIATRLRLRFGDIATVARVRNDGFALLPHRHLHETEALNLAESCIALLCGDGMPATAVAAGIAFARDLAAPSADALLRNAELASQRARRAGQNRCEVFDAEHHRGLLSRLRIEQALRDAFAAQELSVHYQPEIDLRDGRWCAAEALLRWRGEDGGFITAAEFIDIAEASGLIVPLGRWVLRHACAAACVWPQPAGGGAPVLRVNVSARQFEQAGLVADVAAALADTGLAPARLCLELTETTLLPDLVAAGQILAQLRALGVSVALDDFGLGYSSLGYLKQLPINALKLDKSFIAGLPDDRYDRAIVEAVAGLAQRLGIEVVAEGVETAVQAEALRACGIFHAQGHLYAAALTQAELLQRFGDKV